MFMCRRHWYMLPKATRDAVWAAYVPGQEIRKDPTGAYIDVATEAVLWLARREGLLPERAQGALQFGTAEP
jgi:hypothetical protein